MGGAVAKSLSDGGLQGFERDVVTERFELSDEAFGEAVWVLVGVVVAAEVVVELACLEHVPGGGQDRVAAGGDRFAVAAAAAQALVLGGEVGVFGAGRCVGGVRQCGFEGLVSFGCGG